MNSKNWIIDKLYSANLDKARVYDLYDLYKKETNSSCTKESYKRFVLMCFEKVSKSLDIKDYNDDSVIGLEASRQKLLDINNTIRKTNREQYRIYNNLDELYSEYVEVLKTTDLTKFKITKHDDKSSKVGIIHLSDIHANELIQPSEANNNSYDFTVLSKRLKKFISEATSHMKNANVKTVYLFLTGDLINSSRRLGEKLAQATSLVRASLLLTYILQQAIVELSKDFNVSVASIVGNESRISEEYGSSDIEASENFDYLIFQNLKMIFSKSPVNFINSNSNIQTVIKLKNGFNALILHGNSFKSSNIEQSVAKTLQSYVYSGTNIHGVFLGHYHSASIGDLCYRSSSLCGGNAYSTNDLGYLSRASQNCYIIKDDLSVTGIKIDLQNTDNVQGYDIKEELERYNVRSCNANCSVTIKNLV